MFVFIQRINDALKWVAALQLAAREEYNAALDKLESIKGMKDSVQPTLLRAMIHLELGQYQLAQNDADAVIARIGTDKRNVTELYLAAYANWVGDLANARRNVKYAKYLPDYSCIDLQKVPSDIIRKFPLREHPGWM